MFVYITPSRRKYQTDLVEIRNEDISGDYDKKQAIFYPGKFHGSG